jgi:hypothetical protein
MREHTHSCEHCGKERRCRCEDGEDFQYVPCDPCLDDPVTPPWEQESRSHGAAHQRGHTHRPKPGAKGPQAKSVRKPTTAAGR